MKEIFCINIVTCLLEARNLKSVEIAVAREWLCKQWPLLGNGSVAITQSMMEETSLALSVPRLYKEEQLPVRSVSRNMTLTLTLTYTKGRPLLSSERAPHKNKTVNAKQ
jgi:hypothetical protein